MRTFRARNKDHYVERVSTEGCRSYRVQAGDGPFSGLFLHRTRTGRWFKEGYYPPINTKRVRGKELTLEEVRALLPNRRYLPEPLRSLLREHRHGTEPSRQSTRESQPVQDTLVRENDELAQRYHALVRALGSRLSPKERKVLEAVPVDEPVDGRTVAEFARVTYDGSLKGILKKLCDLCLVDKRKGKGGYILSAHGEESLNGRRRLG